MQHPAQLSIDLINHFWYSEAAKNKQVGCMSPIAFSGRLEAIGRRNALSLGSELKEMAEDGPYARKI